MFGAAWIYGRAPLRREESVLGGRSRFDFEQSARLSGSSRLGGADFRRLSVSKLANALRALAVRRIASARTDVLTRRFDSVKLDARRLIVFAPKTERYKNNGVREVPIAPILKRELVAHLKTMPQDEDFLIYENRRKAFDSGFRKIIFAAGLKNQSKTFRIIGVAIKLRKQQDRRQHSRALRRRAQGRRHSVKTQETYINAAVLPEFFDRVTQKEPRFF